MTTQNSQSQLMEIAGRIRELREIFGYSYQDMAGKTEISEDEIKDLEDELQKATDKFVKDIDKAVEEKAQDILKV